MNEFTKADLRYGYLVVMRNGNKAIYMPSTKGDTFDFQNDAECLLLDKYNNTLNYTGSKNYDVMKVYGLAQPYETTSFNSKRRSLVWEREEIKRMTVEEMRTKLEELTGEKYEIEPDRNGIMGTLCQYCLERGCDKCVLKGFGKCYFHTLSDEELKQCYEKVIDKNS